MNVIMNILIIFQTLIFWAYLDKYFERYPIKKMLKDEIDAPIPNNIF